MFNKKPTLDKVLLRELVVGQDAMHHLQFCSYFVKTGNTSKLQICVGIRGKRQVPEMDYILITHVEEALRRAGYNPHDLASVYGKPNYVNANNLTELFVNGLPSDVTVITNGMEFKVGKWLPSKVTLKKADVKQHMTALVCLHPKTKRLVHIPVEFSCKLDYSWLSKLFERCFALGLCPYALSSFDDTMEEHMGYSQDVVPNLYNRYLKPYL